MPSRMIKKDYTYFITDDIARGYDIYHITLPIILSLIKPIIILLTVFLDIIIIIIISIN